MVGLIGHLCAQTWGKVIFAAALGITLYWPLVCLVALVHARDATGWDVADETPYWVSLPFIALWGAWGLWALRRECQTMSWQNGVADPG